jgi:hypothetical protein
VRSFASDRQLDLLELLHEIAEDRALGAAGGAGLLLELVLVVGLAFGAHHDDLELLVVVHAGDHVVGLEHVLVQEIPDRQIVRVVADRHHGDDLLAVQEQGERPLNHHPGLDRRAVLVNPADRLGQPRVLRVRAQQVLAQGGAFRGLGASPAQGFDLGLGGLFGDRLAHFRSNNPMQRRKTLFGLQSITAAPARAKL